MAQGPPPKRDVHIFYEKVMSFTVLNVFKRNQGTMFKMHLFRLNALVLYCSVFATFLCHFHCQGYECFESSILADLQYGIISATCLHDLRRPTECCCCVLALLQ